MSETERSRKIFSRIADLTMNGTLRWTRANVAGAFCVSVGGTEFRILSEDGDDIAPFRFMIVNDQGNAVEALRSVPENVFTHEADKDRNRMLAELYDKARSQALGIDDVLSKAERDLDLD